MVASRCVEKLLPKGKDSSAPEKVNAGERELAESDNLARFHHTYKSQPKQLVSPPDRTGPAVRTDNKHY